jgi:hypothetical protein
VRRLCRQLPGGGNQRNAWGRVCCLYHPDVDQGEGWYHRVLLMNLKSVFFVDTYVAAIF